MREMATPGDGNLARGTCIHIHAGDGFADTQSLDAETSPSLTLHLFIYLLASMAEHTHLHLLDTLIFSIKL